MSNYKEDDIVNSLIEYETRNPNNEPMTILNIEPECSFNYYGCRGYIDLLIQKEEVDWVLDFDLKSNGLRVFDYLYEVKTKLTNANEICRQLQKYFQYFYKGKNSPYKTYWELVVYPSFTNYEHLQKYNMMYSALEKNYNFHVTFRHPEHMRPIRLLGMKDGFQQFVDYYGKQGNIQEDELYI